MNYQIKEDGEDKVFLQTGGEHEFSESALKNNVKDLLKAKTEAMSQSGLESSKIENILEFNPFIKDLTEEQCHAVWLYQQSVSVKKMAERQLEAVEVALKEVAEAVKEIKEQTGYEVDTSLPPITLTAEDLEKLKQ